MHIDGILFLTSLSEHMHYSTAELIDNITCIKLENKLKNVARCYAVRCFRVTVILLDMEFKVLKDRNIVGVIFNIVARGEYMTKIEWFHEVIKE